MAENNEDQLIQEKAQELLDAKQKKEESDALPQKYMQIFGFISLWIMLIIDRIMHLVTPPFSEHWYGAVFGLVISGKAYEMIKKFNDKR